MIGPIAALLGFQLVGEALVRLFGLALPGPVLGLVLLLAALLAWKPLAEWLRPVASGLLGHLSLLFVPAGVGVVGHLDLLASHGIALVLALLGSTALALLAGAWTFQALSRLTGGGEE